MGAARVSRRAELDMLGIWLHIAEANVAAAERMIQRFQKRIRQLARFPESGQKRDDIARGVRVTSVEHYLILYWIVEEDVEILRVVHGSRDLRQSILNAPET